MIYTEVVPISDPAFDLFGHDSGGRTVAAGPSSYRGACVKWPQNSIHGGRRYPYAPMLPAGGLVDRAMTISPMDNPLDLAQQIYAALDDEDTGPFLELCAADATVEYPAAGRLPYGGNWSGKVAIDQFLAAHEAAEEILVFEPDEMHAAGEKVFVLGRFEGRARDSGRTWSTNFVHVLTVRNGLLARWQSFFDSGAALEAHS